MCLSVLKNILQSYPFETKNKDFLAARKGFKIRTLVFFIKKRRYIRVFRFNLNLIKKIKQNFDKNDLNFPYPQHDIHIISQPE